MIWRQGKPNFVKRSDICACGHPTITHYRPDGSCVVLVCNCKAFKSVGSKYGIRHERCNLGHSHGSGAEARFCGELEYRKKAGDIVGYQSQVLEELRGRNNTVVATWKVDFRIQHKGGEIEFVEVKGRHLEEKPDYRLKRNLLLDKYRYKKNVSFRVVMA